MLYESKLLCDVVTRIREGRKASLAVRDARSLGLRLRYS